MIWLRYLPHYALAAGCAVNVVYRCFNPEPQAPYVSLQIERAMQQEAADMAKERAFFKSHPEASPVASDEAIRAIDAGLYQARISRPANKTRV